MACPMDSSPACWVTVCLMDDIMPPPHQLINVSKAGVYLRNVHSYETEEPSDFACAVVVGSLKIREHGLGDQIIYALALVGSQLSQCELLPGPNEGDPVEGSAWCRREPPSSCATEQLLQRCVKQYHSRSEYVSRVYTSASSAGAMSSVIQGQKILYAARVVIELSDNCVDHSGVLSIGWSSAIYQVCSLVA